MSTTHDRTKTLKGVCCVQPVHIVKAIRRIIGSFMF